MGIGSATRERSPGHAVDGVVEEARPWSLRAAQFVVLGAPVVAFVGAGWAHRQITDDGFIYLRVVQQIRAGNGPVFNAGQRVEAFTGPLWVAVLTVARIVTPVRLEWIAAVLGLVASAFGLAMVIAGARRLARTDGTDAFVVPFGVLVFIAILPSWIFGTSGLETGLSFAWLGLSFWLLVGWAQSRSRVSAGSALVLGLGWLVRPELVLFSAAFLGIVLGLQWRKDRWRDRGLIILAMTALPVAYQVFRMGFYGSLVTNTAIAKEGTSTNWDRGWAYLRDFADPYWLWVPGVLLVAGGYVPLALVLRRACDRRGLFVVASFLVAGLLAGTYVVAVGGDYIHGRLLLPALFAICAPVAVVAATRRHLAALLLAPWVLAAVLILRPAEMGNLARGFYIPRAYGQVTRDDFGWGAGSPRWNWYTGPGFYFQPRVFNYDWRRLDVPLKQDVALPAVALLAIGAPSYALGPDFDVLDVLGLADPLTSHFNSTPSLSFFPRLAGHEKPMPSVWFAARITLDGANISSDDFPKVSSPLIPVTSGKEFQEQVAWARAALRCPEIRDLTTAPERPLTAGRFLDNFVSSFSYTRMRIPADPQAAYRRFCGSGRPREVRELNGGR